MCDRGTWNFNCKEYPYGLIYKKNFKFLCRTVSEKNAMLTCKISKLFIRTIVQLWIFASYHRIFLEKCATEEMKFGLQRVSIWVNIQKKISSSSVAQYRRKMRCELVKFQSCLLGQLCKFEFLKLSSHFSRKLCDRGTWNLICKEYPYGLIYKKNFKFLGRTVSEKNAMLTCKISKLFNRTIVQLWIFASYHRIFLKNYATESQEIWFAKSIHMG